MKFSIITINYNNSNGLDRTIKSVISQTYRDFEYIIIDGGSKDGSIDKIKTYAENLDYWISEPDNGIYNAMNKGIAIANGDYLLFLNSGDCLVNSMVLENVNKCNSNTDLIYGNLIREKTIKTYKIVKYPVKLTLYHFYANVPSLHQQATFIKQSLFTRYGNFREDFKIISDWEFFLRCIIINNCSAKYIDLNIALFDSSGISSNRDIDESNLKIQVLQSLFPQRILDDYEYLTQSKENNLSKIKKWIIRNSFLASLFRFFYLPLKKANEFLTYLQHK